MWITGTKIIVRKLLNASDPASIIAQERFIRVRMYTHHKIAYIGADITHSHFRMVSSVIKLVVFPNRLTKIVTFNTSIAVNTVKIVKHSILIIFNTTNIFAANFFKKHI